MTDGYQGAVTETKSAKGARRPAARASAGGQSYLESLLDQGLLIDTGLEGVYGRSEAFEEVVDSVSALIGMWGLSHQAELLRFPPAMGRATLEQSGYLANFPQLAGAVYSFCGGEAEHQRLLRCLDGGTDAGGQAWDGSQRPTRLAMTPVACYPVYPVMARRGPLPPEGRTLDIFSYCFRHEPSLAPERMQLFRQREFVRMDKPAGVVAFRQEWMAHALDMFAALGLPAEIAVAHDPFFGRAGRVMADSQRNQQLKFELLVPGVNPERPIACGSFNYHMDRFSSIWGILDADGQIAHTGCCGFGLERVALSLFKWHGFEIRRWPAPVRRTLRNARRRRGASALNERAGV
ncbi:seryl-tRNA synthetase [Pandoraea thiooxydans]|uniref:amino acid--[acyl-carrier-protein] ligase n=1 Tax=Pandoraea thiooxydans TaxID=445709 RepID=UPI000640630C|nr:amino acid--[acyl-carrier-protein] ligase [Pandoraea thiooxydans]AKJ68891.1 hypothetical protein ABW99_12400 [Pandoraea thiooxydans]APR96396.1 seryl-tRNA synthetase [Pandoraea thiooxydans]